MRADCRWTLPIAVSCTTTSHGIVPQLAPAYNERGGEKCRLTVRDRHLEEALAELLVAGGALTQSLLGGHREVN
jgi:hypothetical protein